MNIEWKWKVAKIGFKLMKPWIQDQADKDGDSVQVEEILLDQVYEVLHREPKIFSNVDYTGIHGMEGFDYCRAYYFESPAVLESDQEGFVQAAIDSLEQLLGYMFDEDSWYAIDWRDAQELWIHFNEPYESRRLYF